MPTISPSPLINTPRGFWGKCFDFKGWNFTDFSSIYFLFLLISLSKFLWENLHFCPTFWEVFVFILSVFLLPLSVFDIRNPLSNVLKILYGHKTTLFQKYRNLEFKKFNDFITYKYKNALGRVEKILGCKHWKIICENLKLGVSPPTPRRYCNQGSLTEALLMKLNAMTNKFHSFYKQDFWVLPSGTSSILLAIRWHIPIVLFNWTSDVFRLRTLFWKFFGSRFLSSLFFPYSANFSAFHTKSGFESSVDQCPNDPIQKRLNLEEKLGVLEFFLRFLPPTERDRQALTFRFFDTCLEMLFVLDLKIYFPHQSTFPQQVQVSVSAEGSQKILFNKLWKASYVRYIVHSLNVSMCKCHTDLDSFDPLIIFKKKIPLCRCRCIRSISDFKI